MNRSKDIKPKSESAPQSSKVDQFLAEVDAAGPVAAAPKMGRLIFGLDATLSRQPSWDQATAIQSQMFEAVTHLGGLEMQIAFYRGLGEFRKSPWSQNGADLARRMSRVRCMGGLTQISRVLRHGIKTARQEQLDALVFVGDAMEENPDELCDLAGQLGVYGCPLFIFQEGVDAQVQMTFQSMARLSHGAYARFEEGSADALRDLLKAVAVYASGGADALQQLAQDGGEAAQALLGQIGKGNET